MFKEIVVCADGSDTALEAARVAAELASKFQANVTLLSVFNQSAAMVPFIYAPESVPYAANIIQVGEEMQESIQQKTGQIFEEKGVPYQSRRETGHPVDTIVNVAIDRGRPSPRRFAPSSAGWTLASPRRP